MLPAARPPLSSTPSYSHRPMRPSARENGRLRPLGVSAMAAPQCVHGAIGESYLQLKQLEAITQVRLTPVSTYR